MNLWSEHSGAPIRSLYLPKIQAGYVASWTTLSQSRGPINLTVLLLNLSTRPNRLRYDSDRLIGDQVVIK
jgi:hypothetical protein